MAPLIVALMYACRIYSDDLSERASEVNASEPTQLRLLVQEPKIKEMVYSCQGKEKNYLFVPNLPLPSNIGIQREATSIFHVLSRRRQKLITCSSSSPLSDIPS